MGAPKVIYQEELGKNSWLRYIKARIKDRNENFMCGVTGGPGVGKTYTGLSIGEMLKDEYGFIFDINHVVFSFLDLMKLINDANLKRGSVILFDEPQTEINSKNHQSEINKVFYQLTSTFRHRGFVLLFCNPFLEDLDKSTRKLFHANFQVLSKDEKNKLAKVKPLYLEWSSSKDDWYKHFLRVVHKPQGKSKFISSKLTSWNIPHPSKELADEYEIKKMAFTTALNKKIQERLQMIENGNNKPTISPLDKLTDKQTEVIETILRCSTQQEAAEELGITPQAVSGYIRLAEKKGVCLANYEKLKTQMPKYD
jgi:predicted DNA-binding protein YlxM (UPF0122 family)